MRIWPHICSHSAIQKTKPRNGLELIILPLLFCKSSIRNYCKSGAIIIRMEMKVKNQIVIISVFAALLLVTAILVGTYNIQTVKALSSGGSNLGQNIVSPRATTGQGCPIGTTGSCNTFNPNGNGLGSFISGKAHEGGVGGML